MNVRNNHDGLNQVHPFFLIMLGWLGLVGCVMLIAGCIVAAYFVPDYNWITDTISDLAAGQSEFIMDFSLYGFSGGVFATALAASHKHCGRKRWSAGILSLSLIAALVVIIAARDEYGDSDPGGLVIHSYLVYALGALFLLMTVLMSWDLAKIHKPAKWILLVLGAIWTVIAPIFFLAPTGIDGFLERVLGLVACAIIATLCIAFIRYGRSINKIVPSKHSAYLNEEKNDA